MMRGSFTNTSVVFMRINRLRTTFMKQENDIIFSATGLIEINVQIIDGSLNRPVDMIQYCNPFKKLKVRGYD